MKSKLASPVLLSLFLVCPAFAKSVALSLVGTAEIKDKYRNNEVTGKEWHHFLYQSACMKKAGWEVKSVQSTDDLGEKSELQGKFEKVLGKENVQQLQVTNPGLSTKQKGELFKKGQADKVQENNQMMLEQAEQKFNEAMLSAAEGLKPGDQFLLQVSGHGKSNCDVKQNGTMSKGAKGYTECDHTFDFMFAGTNMKIRSSQLTSALEELQKKGIKTAVQIHSCNGGAAIKDFAAKGLCAHAYSSPDTVMVMCGGADTPADWSASTPDMAAFGACRHLSKKDMADVSKKLNTNPDTAKCAEKSHENLQALGLKDDVSSAEFFDKLRNQDPTANQPMGSDGPYWVFGNLGFMGLAGMSYDDGRLKPTYQTDIAECTTKETYFSGMIANLQEISQSILGKDCKMAEELEGFVKNNDKDLSAYFDSFKKMNMAVGKVRELLKEKIPEKLRQQMLKVSSEELNDPFLDKESKKTLKEKLNANPMAVIEECVASEQGKCRETLEAGLPAKALQEIQSSIQDINQKEAAPLRDHLRKTYKEKIMKLERKLYQDIKSSPAYARCVKAHPHLQAAKAACEGFKAP